ncbi:MAG: PilN domain-containing protein [Gammaproteobacteria bacterium]
MLDLNSTIDLDFKKFLRWWGKELSFLVPEKIRLLVNERQGSVIICTKGDQLELTYLSDAQSEKIAILDRNEEGVAQYKALLAKDERLAKADFILRLGRDDGICKELVLPSAAKENLTQVVSYELSRFTPFNPEQVYFAVKPLDTVNEPGQLGVMLILTTREELDALYEDVRAMGISPEFADYEGWANDLDQYGDYYDLLPEPYRPQTAKLPRMVYAALAGAVCLLFLAAIYLPVWFEYQTVELLHEKINAIEKDAKKIKGLQSDIDSVIEESKALIELKNSTPPVIEMLNSLSILIKDDTWLSYLKYSNGQLQIQGESPAASGLIAVLEDSEMFKNAKFVSPVTQNKATGSERFQITADVTKPEEASVENPK